MNKIISLIFFLFGLFYLVLSVLGWLESGSWETYYFGQALYFLTNIDIAPEYSSWWITKQILNFIYDFPATMGFWILAFIFYTFDNNKKK